MGKKYNVGDHVIVESSNVDDVLDFRGKTGVIKNCLPTGNHDYLIQMDDNPSHTIWCNVKCLVDDVSKDKIVITHDGKVTTATRYIANGKKVTATASCSPEDTFDFNVGAKLALERLTGKINEDKKPEYYNGKVVCINSGNVPMDLTVGKIYNFVDGRCKNNYGGQITSTPVKDCDDLNNRFISCVKFIPIVE